MKSVSVTRPSGFTIVELLVVIVVIAILASVSVVAYRGVRDRANDSKRSSDMNSIVKALEYYKSIQGRYPSPTSANGSWEMSAEDSPGDFIESLANYGFPGGTPTDPVNSSSTYSYYYYRYGAGTSGCDVASGAFLVLGVKSFESTSGIRPDSPGFSCPSRDWQGEFEWVIGRFED